MLHNRKATLEPSLESWRPQAARDFAAAEMTDIGASAAVFTNNAGGDLLQQAFQQVVGEDGQDGAAADFVAFLQSDGAGESQLIQITAEQAAALGITFKVEDDLLQQTSSDSLTPGFQELQQKQQQPLSHEESQRIINELTQSGLLKPNNAAADQSSFDEWSVQQQNEESESYQQEAVDSNLALDTMKLDGLQQEQKNDMEQTNNVLEMHSDQRNEQENPKSMETQCNGNVLQNTIRFSIASNNEQNDGIAESQAQILQRFPVILPSSQFIIKPAQTVLTPLKNIRILPNINKVTNTAQISQNSLLLPKPTVLNTISPQLLKALPIGTQFLNATNNLSAQLLNSSRIFAKNNDRSNSHLVTESLCRSTNINTVPAMTHNLIRQSPAQKPVQTQAQKGNLQQFFTPIIKTTANAHTAVKNTSLLNTNALKQNTSTPALKTVQYPSQTLKTAYAKSPVTSLSTSKNKNTPVIFRTAPVMKSNDDQKSSSISTPIIRAQTNTPVSILKPQTKTVNNNFKQNLSNTFVAQKSPQTKPIELSESLGLKPLVAAKLKQSVNSFIKNIKKKTTPSTVPPKPEATNTNKPLGSSENPIQIVQQGTTFHSMQHLSQAQLKQIAQILHQRSQDSTNPNEKVVYRLVFPDEIDLRMKSPTSLLKNRGGKRGRPKKSSIRPPSMSNKSTPEEAPEDAKDDRKKIVARTRSGRLSRPPRHMVRDYKHLHHLDFMQPEFDDSDGGYSDYNTSGSGNNIVGVGNGTGKAEDDDDSHPRTELLAGLEMPKRKISDHFRCPTCSKIYLGRTRMTRHFEMHPDHGSIDHLPPPTAEPDPNKTPPQDPLKRKGKKRGPWAYVTPEAKSERRQLKLQEAISVCESTEIAKIAGKPVASALPLFDLLLLKSGNNVRTFLSEIKELVERIREKTSTMLSVANNEDKLNDDVVDLNGELLCDVLALNSGFYRVNEAVCLEEPETEERNPSENFETEGGLNPPQKRQKTDGVLEEGKDNIEERLSSGFSESSDLSVSDFLNERRNDSTSTSTNCPEVLSALTLMPKNNSVYSTNEASTKVNNVSKVLNSGAEMQAIDNPGFQKLSINVSAKSNSGFMKEATFTKLGENLDSSCNDVFTKLNGNYDQAKLENLERTFIKLEPTEEGFIKLENGMLGAFHQEIEDFGKIQNNGFHYVSSGASDSFSGNKGFKKLIPKTTSANSATNPNDCLKVDDENNDHEVDDNSVQITTSSCSSNNPDSNIFEATDNLDISKMTNYDHITHLDILSSSGAIDKNLLIDEKLVEHLHLVDNSNIVDELVSERLKSMMPENLLESNLLHSNGNLDTELDFDELSEEFNRNTRS